MSREQMLPAADHSVITTSTCYKPTPPSPPYHHQQLIIQWSWHLITIIWQHLINHDSQTLNLRWNSTFALLPVVIRVAPHSIIAPTIIMMCWSSSRRESTLVESIGRWVEIHHQVTPSTPLLPPTVYHPPAQTYISNLLPECGTQDGTPTRVGKFSGLPDDIFRA